MCPELFHIASIFTSFVFRSNSRPNYLAQFFQETLIRVFKYGLKDGQTSLTKLPTAVYQFSGTF